MSPRAEQLKKTTIERYEYLVNDGFPAYEDRLREARDRPDSFWENVVLSVRSYE